MNDIGALICCMLPWAPTAGCRLTAWVYSRCDPHFAAVLTRKLTGIRVGHFSPSASPQVSQYGKPCYFATWKARVATEGWKTPKTAEHFFFPRSVLKLRAILMVLTLVNPNMKTKLPYRPPSLRDLLTYLLHGAGSFLSSWLACS